MSTVEVKDSFTLWRQRKILINFFRHLVSSWKGSIHIHDGNGNGNNWNGNGKNGYHGIRYGVHTACDGNGNAN